MKHRILNETGPKLYKAGLISPLEITGGNPVVWVTGYRCGLKMTCLKMTLIEEFMKSRVWMPVIVPHLTRTSLSACLGRPLVYRYGKHLASGVWRAILSLGFSEKQLEAAVELRGPQQGLSPQNGVLGCLLLNLSRRLLTFPLIRCQSERIEKDNFRALSRRRK